MYIFNDHKVDVCLKTLSNFYRKKCGFVYKRCTTFKRDRFVNAEALTGLLEFILDHLKKNYTLCSVDETGFGSKPLRRYGWARKGEEACATFN